MDLLAIYTPDKKMIIVEGNPKQLIRLANEITDCKEICEFRLNPPPSTHDAYSDCTRINTLQIRVWEKYLREVIVDVDQSKLIISGDDNEFRVLVQEIKDLCDVVTETGYPSHFHIEYYGDFVTVTPNTWATVIACEPEDAT